MNLQEMLRKANEAVYENKPEIAHAWMLKIYAEILRKGRTDHETKNINN